MVRLVAARILRLVTGETIAALIVGAIAGVIGNLLVGWRFYKRSGAELREESDKLRRMVSVLARTLQESGAIEATWAENGELRGAVIHGSSIGRAGARGQNEVATRKSGAAAGTAGATGLSEGRATIPGDKL